MPKPKQPELGVRGRYDARYGITVGGCEGLDLTLDPSGDPESLRDAVNCRVDDEIVRSRFGQALQADTGIGGCVQGLIDIDGLGTRLVFAESGTNDPDEPATLSIFDASTSDVEVFVDTLEAVPFNGQNIVDFPRDQSLPRYAYFSWGGRTIFPGRLATGTAVEPSKIYEFLVPEDDPVGEAQTRELFATKVPTEVAEFRVNTMCSLPTVGGTDDGGPLYFGTMGGGVVALVNGQLIRLQAEGTWPGRVFVFEYNNRLYGSGGDVLRVQDGWLSGASPVSTSWSNVPLPPTLAGFAPMCAIEWNGTGLVGGAVGGFGGARMIQIVDSGGGPIVINEIGAVQLTGANTIDSFAIAFGNTLYVGFTQGGGLSFLAKVATWDGATLGVPLPETWGETSAMITRLQGMKDRLYVLGWGTDGPNQSGLWVWDETAMTETLVIGKGFGGTIWYDALLF